MEVTSLPIGEVVRIEIDRAADAVVERGSGLVLLERDRALEEIVELLCGLEAAWQAGEISRLSALASLLKSKADAVGFLTLSDVAERAGEVARSNDSVALSALVARTIRVGESSLAIIWHVGGLRL